MADDADRDEQLDEILATYEGYDRGGRSSLWDLDNPGFRRLSLERDAAIDGSIAASAGPGGRARLLDLGCGNGSLAVRLRAEGLAIDVTGVDLVPGAVEAARQNAPWATFRTGSADRLEDDDASYDILTAITLFSSLPSAALEVAVAREAGRVLRPGGHLVWYDIRYRNPWNAAVHGVSKARLAELFPGWAMDLRSFSVLPPVARRLGHTTPILYPALHAIPPFRSHLVGRLTRP